MSRPLVFEAMEPRQLLATLIPFVVNNTGDNGGINPVRGAGTGTLRQAIVDANMTPNPAPSISDQIVFALPTTGLDTIHLLAPLPTITDPVDINGYSVYDPNAVTVPKIRDQTFSINAPIIQLDGTSPGAGPDGLTIATTNCWVGGLVITNFRGAGINLLPGPTDQHGAIGDTIWGNFLGVTSFDRLATNLVTRGANPLANGLGISISSSNNVIGDILSPRGNIIQGNNGPGITLSGPTGTGNLVYGNDILDNAGDGVSITTSNNIIGDTDATANNVISGNIRGVRIQGATGNVVQNNEIGADLSTNLSSISASSTRPNLLEGVLIEDAPGNLIGGSLSGAGNLISHNGSDGVSIQNKATTGATANQVQGNSISFNRDGINVSSANNLIGGAVVGGGNILASNRRNGITISSKALDIYNELDVSLFPNADIPNAQPTGNLVVGNLVGTFDGVHDLGNTLDGILIMDAAGNTIGGTALLARNVISGNNIGLTIRDAASTGNVVQGNFIGTASNALGILSNALDGIRIEDAPGNLIGGTAQGAANVISGNNWGVRLTGVGATGNVLQGNSIGTDLQGTTNLRNAIDGVLILQGAANNTIGGLATGAGNAIAYNVGNGVNFDVLAGTGNAIYSNKIYGNNLLGINLPGGTDTSGGPGPNDLQSYPVLTSVIAGNLSSNIQGTLQSTPGTTFLVQFFTNPPGTTRQLGQGATLIGSTTVTTDSGGAAIILTAVSTSVPVGTLVTATATNLTTGDTSAFSRNRAGGVSASIFDVTNTNDSGPGSLRQAILFANALPNAAPSIPDQIAFVIPGVGPFTIHLTSTLPTITDPVDIEGYTQSGSHLNKTVLGTDELETDVAVLMIQVEGSALGAGANGLTIATVGSTVSGLIITNFKGAGIALIPGATDSTSAIGNDIWGNFIGVSTFDIHSSSLVPRGGNPLANGVGIAISSSNNRIGGTLPPSRNVFQGNNGVGVSLFGTAGTGNLIEGDYILDNLSDGILVTTSNNYIGEAIGFGPAGGGDIISGNLNGIHLVGIPAQGNVIVNNEIGTDVGLAGVLVPVRGMDPRPNLIDGILVEDATGNTIGGLIPNAFNVIAANGYDGVSIQNVATQGAIGNQVIGDKIGYNLRGGIISRMPNRDGINISSANNIIGGATTAARNVIIDNLRNGITISSMVLDSGNRELGPSPNAQPTGNLVEGNYIGTQGGADNFGNKLEGVLIDAAADNLIGGAATGALNVISANNDGVTIRNPASVGNIVAGNLIGTMADGVTVLGNAVFGVNLDNAPSNTVGGTSTAAANVISGNNWGVRIGGANATGNLVQGNSIGTDLSGLLPVRNAIDGVLITAGASNNAIGGAGAGNAIAYNVGNGVNVLSGASNAILSNKIYGNSLLGIDLAGDGVTPNHPNGGAGPNDLQSYPVLTAVTASSASTSIQGTFTSIPNTSFLVEFFANTATTRSGYGQGANPIGSIIVMTDGGGNAPIVASVSSVVPNNVLVSATATNLTTNDTSEFSQVRSSTPVMVQFAAASDAVAQDAGSITIDVRRGGNPGSLVTVDYATGGGSAQPGINYTSTAGTLTFNPGETDKTFVIPVIDTHLVAANTTVNLTLGNPTGGATLVAPNPVILTIQNNNQVTLQLGAAGFAAGELDGTANITVTRNSGSSTSTIAYTTTGGSATPGLNYTPTSGTLVFGPGQTSKTFAIPILHDNLATGPLSVGIALSSPTGGLLGDPGTAVLTINDVDRPGTLQLGRPSMTISPAAGVARVVVNRVGGAGGTVSVHFATGGGSAVPGTDYTPVSGILTFNPGEMSKTIVVPILNNPAGGARVFSLTLDSPGGGAALGSPASIAVTISPGASQVTPDVPGPDVTPNATGPVITDLQLLNDGQTITGIVLSFSRPLDAARAQDVANYGYVIRTPGADRAFGTFDDGTTPIASATYDPATNRVTLTPASPLSLNTSYLLTINQNASILTGAGVADTTGALLDTGVTGGPYAAQFALGTRLSYTDHNGDIVSLNLTGGGLIELRRRFDGEAQQLRIVGAAQGNTRLNGHVRRGGKGSDGRTTLPLILSPAGVKIHLRSFAIGRVDSPPTAQGHSPGKTHHRHRHP